MLQPKKTKYRKQQKGRLRGQCSNLTQLTYGQYGIKALKAGVLSSTTIETLRRTLARTFNRSGKIWIKIFPDKIMTAKPAEVRMGKGKGAPSYWVARFKAGQILFELDGVACSLAQQAALNCAPKIPVAVQFVKM